MARATMLAAVRAFFQQRNVLEVETPLLAPFSVSDPYLQAVYVERQGWLQTSPEFAMKRLLAAGSGDIYQICKSFRGGEQGRHHNQEFSLLEWYRLGFDATDLMAETAELLSGLLSSPLPSSPSNRSAEQISYAQLFEQVLGCNPHKLSANELVQILRAQNIECTEADRSGMLDVLFSHRLQPTLQNLTFVYDYPQCQAALARVETDAKQNAVARRFECFYQGVELGNGYHELQSAEIYRERHAEDNALRKKLGLAEIALDPHFVAAMEHGLPDCAGIAIGLDRVLMLAQQEEAIANVMSFANG